MPMKTLVMIAVEGCVANIHIEMATRVSPSKGILYGKFTIACNNTPITEKMILMS
jgi:hypothetical protein